ncbi:hypothetical protein LINPERHAP1_LOCUS34849, partial [Linum perenne]
MASRVRGRRRRTVEGKRAENSDFEGRTVELDRPIFGLNRPCVRFEMQPANRSAGFGESAGSRSDRPARSGIEYHGCSCAAVVCSNSLQQQFAA